MSWNCRCQSHRGHGTHGQKERSAHLYDAVGLQLIQTILAAWMCCLMRASRMARNETDNDQLI